MKAFIWTDGSCLKNNHGGWAFFFRYNNIDWEVSGNDTNTTNNRMELKAVINSITFSKDIKELIIFTDSKYVINGITKWINNWIKNNWKNIKNKDLWLQLHDLVKNQNIIWHWVKGHSKNILNNRVDFLAKNEAKNIS